MVGIQWVLADVHLPGCTMVITTCWHSFQQFQKGYRIKHAKRLNHPFIPWMYSLPLVLAKAFWKILLWTSVAGVSSRKTEGNNQEWVATAETRINASDPLAGGSKGLYPPLLWWRFSLFRAGGRLSFNFKSIWGVFLRLFFLIIIFYHPTALNGNSSLLIQKGLLKKCVWCSNLIKDIVPDSLQRICLVRERRYYLLKSKSNTMW